MAFSQDGPWFAPINLVFYGWASISVILIRLCTNYRMATTNKMESSVRERNKTPYGRSGETLCVYLIKNNKRFDIIKLSFQSGISVWFLIVINLDQLSEPRSILVCIVFYKISRPSFWLYSLYSSPDKIWCCIVTLFQSALVKLTEQITNAKRLVKMLFRNECSSNYVSFVTSF